MINKKNSEKVFGEIAIEKGFITNEQLENALKIQTDEDTAGLGHRLIGRILLNEGHITLQDVGSVLKSMDLLYEKETDKSFGEIAIEKGFITKEQLDVALRIQTLEYNRTGERKSIGRILLNEGLITLQQIGEVLKDKEDQQ